jgi:hypothetical protein
MPIPYSTIVFGGLTNPVTEDLDLSNNDILNVGTLNYTSLNPAIIGGSGTSSGVVNQIQVADGAGGFSDNSGDTASSSVYTINTTTLIADKTKSIIGINKTPLDYALEIDGSSRPIGATLQMTNGSSQVLYDNNGFQFSTADVQMVSGDFTGSFADINFANAIRSDYANKNVKIGNTTAVADCNLEVFDASAEIRVHGSVSQKLSFYTTSGVTTYDLAEIASAYASLSDGAFTYFRTRVGGSIQTNMVINDEGYVGINQNAPTEKLHVGTSSDTTSLVKVESTSGNLIIGRDGVAHFGHTAVKTIKFDGSIATIGTISNHNMILGTNGNAVITMLSGGNVGINKSLPTHKLEVDGDTSVGNLNVSSAHTDLGLMLSSTLTIDALNYTYRSYIVSTNSNNIDTLTLSNFNVNTQVVVYVYATGAGATINGYTSTLTGSKSAHDDISLSLADTAILTITYDGTNYYAVASKFQ